MLRLSPATGTPTPAPPATGSVTDRLFPPAHTLPRLNLALTPLPAPQRPGAFGVLDITEFFGETSGGIRTYLLEKARWMHAHHDLRQVLVLPGKRDAITEVDGVRCYRLRGPRVPRQPQYRFMLATRSNRRIVRNEHPDVIEVGSPGFVPWIVRLAKRGLGIPAVYFYHSNFPRITCPFPDRSTAARLWLSNGMWWYAKLIDRHFHVTIVSSRFAQQELAAVGIDRVVRVPLGVDLETFSPARRAHREATRIAHGLPRDRPLVFYAGRLTPDKEVDRLIAAWPEVERRTDASLVLAGEGPLRAAIADELAGPRVHLLPYERDRERLADLHAACDVYAAPFSVETFGLSGLEALASGTPVVAADRGGIAEMVEESGAGAHFTSGDAASLADALVGLLARDTAALGLRGRAYAERAHDWDSVFTRLVGVYRDVATRGARGDG
jgi:alpha-1,6-mannosyltransferase